MQARNPDFIQACDDAANCGCVVANAHISDLLKALTASPEILNVLRGFTKNYDFVTEFNRSKVPTGAGGFRLLPPVREEEFVAYAFGILLHIDLGELDLFDLLSRYFSDATNDVNAAYSHFAAAIIERFCRVLTALAGSIASRESAVHEEVSPESVKRMLSECASEASVSATDAARKEAIAILCASLIKALSKESDADTVRALAAGLRYAAAGLGGVEAKARVAAGMIRRITG